MPSFLDACKEYFGSEDLYEVLSLNRTAKDEDIKRAYRRLSLKVHPDRVAENDKAEATEKFKILSKIHATLSDKEKRACYDDTGCVDEDGSGMDRDWSEYWRVLFKKITEEDIKNYEANYRGGDEERGDLISAYKKAKGDLDTILEYVPFSHPNDIPRFQDTLRPLIQNGELPSYSKFLNDTPKKQAIRKRKYESEERKAKKFFQKENRKINKEEADVEESALKAIMARNKQRETESDNFFKHLEAKYGGSSNKKSKAKKK